MHRRIRLLAVCLLWTLPAVALADWPHLRGPSTDGRTAAPGTFSGEAVGLEVDWRVPLGSGYSGIAVSGNRAVTMYADDASDWVGAFDVASGAVLWKHRLGEVTKGHDGSDDGPLATPTVGDGRVFALGADGTLHALDLENGKPLWTQSLSESYGAQEPFFGFTTTPLLAGGTVIVQAGGPEGKSIVALDPATGELRWGREDGPVNYQSPVLVEVDGGEHVVAFDSARMVGLDPADGAVLWSREFAEGERAPNTPAAPMDDSRFLMRIGSDVVGFRVNRTGDGFTVEELYRSNALGQGFSLPVYHDGHVYGYRGSVLTCMDAATGDRVWRSRPPGGDGLIVVDGHLVVFGAKGAVVVADASPEGYREKARVDALGGSSLTWPSFSGGRIFVRNLEEMAAVTVRRGKVGATVASKAGAGDHAFGRFVRDIAGKPDAPARVAALLADHPGGPIVDGEHITFVYRGEAEDVAIAGSMIDAETADAMHRVAGTDLFYRTYELAPGARFEYRFQPDFGDWIVDPRNPNTVPAIDGDDEMSEYRSPEYGERPSAPAEGAPRGTVETFTLASERLGGDKDIRVWLPPGYADGEASYPLLVVHDGENWVQKGAAIDTLDRLAGAGRMSPAVVAFVAAAPQWWLEAGGSRTAEYMAMVVNELVPALEKRYRVRSETDARATLGNRFFAFSAAYLALEHPGSFGTVAIQSPYLGLGSEDAMLAKIDAKVAPETRFYLDWNRWDERNRDRGWNLADDSRDLMKRLAASGYGVEGGEKLDSSGWGGWSSRLGSVLTWMFPPE